MCVRASRKLCVQRLAATDATSRAFQVVLHAAHAVLVQYLGVAWKRRPVLRLRHGASARGAPTQHASQRRLHAGCLECASQCSAARESTRAVARSLLAWSAPRSATRRTARGCGRTRRTDWCCSRVRCQRIARQVIMRAAHETFTLTRRTSEAAQAGTPFPRAAPASTNSLPAVSPHASASPLFDDAKGQPCGACAARDARVRARRAIQRAGAGDARLGRHAARAAPVVKRSRAAPWRRRRSRACHIY